MWQALDILFVRFSSSDSANAWGGGRDQGSLLFGGSLRTDYECS